jgi:hypothetical protein
MSEYDDYESYPDAAKPPPENLRDAPQWVLDRYGFPPKPDGPADEQYAKFWNKLVSPPIHPCPVKFDRDIGPPVQTQPPANLESSLNWSGALVSPPQPKRITLAVAGWIVPEVSHPSPPALFTQADVPRTLIWVGLDGHNGRLPKISLPQIGTFHEPDAAPKDQHFAWLLWWRHSDRVQEIQRIKNLEIYPGQEIMAGLFVIPCGDVSFFIKNQSTGQYRCHLSPQQPLGDIEPLGSSAEWVVERPTAPEVGGKLFPLADYGSVDFRYCMARAADKDGMARAGDKPLEQGSWMTLAKNGLMIKMREAFADPYRTVYVSRAKQRRDKDGSIGVTCTFHDPKLPDGDFPTKQLGWRRKSRCS